MSTVWAKAVRGVGGGVGAKAAPKVLHRLAQFGLVVLDRQYVVGAAILNNLGDGGLCAHSVDGDGATGQGQRGEQFGNGRDLVGLLRRGPLPQHQSCPRRKRRDQVQRGGVDSTRAAAGLAVEGHDLRPQNRQNAADPAPESGLELLRIDQPEHPPEGVVRGNAMGQSQVATQPVQLLPRPQLDLHKRVRPHQHRFHRHHQQLHQVMFHLRRLPGIADRNKHIRQPQPAACLLKTSWKQKTR